MKLLHKLITGIKIKVISSSLNLIELQLSKNGKYWAFLEFFTGSSGNYVTNKDLENFKVHKVFCKNRNNSIKSNIKETSQFKLPELAKIMSDSNIESINLKKMKILFIFDNSQENSTSEVLKNINDSAKNNDINTYILDLGKIKDKKQKPEIMSEINRFSPTIIIFALASNLNRDPEYFLSKEFIAGIKKETNCIVVIICFDIGRISDFLFVDYWQSVTTFFLHVDPIAVKNILDVELGRKFLLWPFPAAYGNQKSIVPKQNRIVFSGSVKEKDRRIWIRSISRIVKGYNLKFQINIFNYYAPKFRLRWSDYMDELSKSLVCLSLGQKSDSHTILPGRTFDAISVGTLVLQQETNDDHPLSFLYTENEHYFKFNCLCEIDHCLEWISSNIYLAQQMGKKAWDFHYKNYSPDRLWKYLQFRIEASTNL